MTCPSTPTGSPAFPPNAAPARRHGIARALAGLLMALLLAPWAGDASPLSAPKPLAPEARRCAEAIIRAEHHHRIPGQLLAAVAVAESGRWMGKERANFAWPWTVTSGRESWFFPTRQAAIDHTRRLRVRGIDNIDVGCMQINLGYHGRAFRTLEEAFDPDINVAYAAEFLTGLNRARHSWALAIGFYHSSDRTRQNHYRRKVMILWNKLRRRAAKLHRLRVIAQFEEKRQARLAARRGGGLPGQFSVPLVENIR